MKKRWPYWPYLFAALFVAAALALAACGGDDDEEGEGELGVEAGKGAQAERAREAGEQAAKQAGDPVELTKITVGFPSIVRAIESARRVEAVVQDAAKVLGWRVIVCDGKGDPVQMARCTDSLLNQDVDAIVQTGIEPSILKSQLREAKERNVPIIEVSGEVTPDPLWSGTYYPDEPLMTRVLDEQFLIPKLEELPEGERKVFVYDFPAIWAKTRTGQFKEDIKGTGIEIVDTHVTDAAALDQDTRRSALSALGKFPDLKAFWAAFDSVLIPLGSTVKSRFPGKEFPDRPLVTGFHADLVTQDAMRKGQIDAVADQAYDQSAWIAMDQLAEFIARKKPFSEDPRPKYPLEFQEAELITPDQLPPEGQYRTPKDDHVTFFTTKWRTEFTNLGGGG